MDARIFALGLLLVLAGMFLMTVGMLRAGGRAEGGGVILIGPFPIAFGTSEGIAKLMLAVGIALAVFFILLGFLFR
ncbi:MAG: DUF131 domain-containing protein [Candidatus Hadarchaeales archaeon]